MECADLASPAYTQGVSIVTISLAAANLEPSRYLVVAWLSADDANGATHTRGLAELWIGGKREGLARMATAALAVLSRPSTVRLVLRVPDPNEAPPQAATAAALVAAARRHDVTYELVPVGEQHDALDAAERFGTARAAGTISAPSAASDLKPRREPLPRLF